MESNSTQTKTAPAKGKKSLSAETVQTLSRMIKDLEDQLDRMLAINEAFEKDLERERTKRTEAERSLKSLEEHLRTVEQEAVGVEDLRAEVSHLELERSRLTATIEEIGRQLSDTEQENRKLTKQAERAREERDDVVEELQSLEAQFQRAMDLVTQTNARLALLGEERDALKGRLKVLEDKLKSTEEERDSLLSEVDESRTALEDIRKSLAEACITTDR
jgi:chromosome segregation ATPase